MMKKRAVKIGKEGLLRRLFPERDVVVRQKGVLRSFHLSPVRQMCLAFVFTGLLSGSVVGIASFIRYDAAVCDRDEKIRAAREAYRDLLTDVAAYREHLGTVAERLEENLIQAREKQTEFLQALSEKNVDLRQLSVEKADMNRLERDRTLLTGEVAAVQGRLAVLDGDADAGVDEKRFSLRRALLQRDLAVAEGKILKDRIAELENSVDHMQETQLTAFQKMGALTQGGIDAVENNLSDIKTTLASAGLNLETLLRRIRRENGTTAAGGPYIPADSLPDMSRKKLNVTLTALNHRLERWHDLTALQEALPIGQPLDFIRVTSPFGAREDPFQGAPARHEAVDLAGMTGQPVYATAPGKVLRSGRWGWYGNMVEIDHGMGFTTRYAHLDKVFVQKGDTVRSGDSIGQVGSSGRSTGPHLHYEVRVRGMPVDPVSFIKAKKDVCKN